MKCLPCEDNLNRVQPEVDWKVRSVHSSSNSLAEHVQLPPRLSLHGHARTDPAFYQPEMPLESAAEAVHMAWMHAAKPTESNFDFFCPFEHLSPEEQLKDYSIAAQAFDFLREGAVNFCSSEIQNYGLVC